MDNLKVVFQEDLGNYPLSEKKLTYKGKTYEFNHYCYTEKEYIMFNLTANDKLIKICSISCDSQMFVLEENEDEYVLYEVVE